MEKPPTLDDALAGKHGPEFQKFAEDCIAETVSKLTDMFGHATMAGNGEVPSGLFATGGIVQGKGPFMVGNGDREHWVPVSGMPAPIRTVEIPTPLSQSVRVKGVIE